MLGAIRAKGVGVITDMTSSIAEVTKNKGHFSYYKRELGLSGY